MPSRTDRAAAEPSKLSSLRRTLFPERASVENLPPRVLSKIQQQQDSSEILISWAQLIIVTTWAVLYVLAPKTFSEAADFEPVPVALAAYFAFTIIRMVLAYRRSLPNWLLYVSAVFDMAVLYALIWSFHLQYEQPPSFYLKAPTLLYVFIFIALRALHFEARFVLASGIAAAVGWLLMLGYAIEMPVEGARITRNYVEYMTSNNVLLGAEFDKVISILLVTAVLALALVRARDLMVRSVVESATAQELSRFVPSQVAQQVRLSDQEAMAGQGEGREATILFTDLEGFSTLSEQITPPEIIATLNEYFSVVAAPIESRGGVISQFQGDAILASFNLPEADPDHAARAIEAALEIQQVLERHTFGTSGLTLRSRVGINSGEVVGGLVGTAERVNYTVHGDDVNLAARLEQLNKEHGTRILVSERTLELAGRERFNCRRIGTVVARGRHAPTVIYAVECRVPRHRPPRSCGPSPPGQHP